MVAEFRDKDADTPVVLMGYLNSVLAMENFAERAAEAGVDGLIMVNLPPEEGDRLQQQLAAHHIDLIYLLAPTTTDERAQQIAAKASGFIYYVSLKGITGASRLQTDENSGATPAVTQLYLTAVLCRFRYQRCNYGKSAGASCGWCCGRRCLR